MTKRKNCRYFKPTLIEHKGIGKDNVAYTPAFECEINMDIIGGCPDDCKGFEESEE